MGQNQLPRLAESRCGARTGRIARQGGNLKGSTHAQQGAMALLSCIERIGSTWWLVNAWYWEAEESEEGPCG